MPRPDDYITVDQATEVVLENEWLTADDILSYIKSSKDIRFLNEIIEGLKKIDLEKLRNEAVVEQL